MNLRWRMLTSDEVAARRRSGKEYFVLIDSWREECGFGRECVRECVLEVLSPEGNWEEVPVVDPP
jgi:hypothetical protein